MPIAKKIYTKREISCVGGVWKDRMGEAVTGLKLSFYKDGTVMDETSLVNGVNNGIQKVYDPTGSLWFENVWKDNTLVSYKKIS